MKNPRRVTTIAGIVVILGASVAHGATFTVTKTVDSFDGVCDSDCSLREAVQAANANATADEVTLPTGVLRLSIFGATEDANASGDIDVTQDITIRGAGAALTTVFQDAGDRVFDVVAAGADVTMRDVTIEGGRSPLDEQGGGIDHPQPGDLVLERVVMRGNVAVGSSTGYGGGIHKAGGRLVVSDSAVIGNVANGSGFGGGIFVTMLSTAVTMTNVTIADNRANQNGGGIFSNNAIAATFVNVTITRNHSTNGAGGVDGDVGGFRFRSSVVSDNTRTSPGNTDCPLSFAPASDGGNVGAGACGFTLPSDVATGNAGLEPLTTASVIPVAVPGVGSPALDRAIGQCPATDARALPRPQGPACDAGAAERAVAVPPAPQAEACTVRGTDGADLLRGTNGPDVICAFGANDVIRALKGDDVVLGGTGNDQVFAGPGADVVFGEAGNDTLDGGTGRDVLLGGAGRDLLLARDVFADLLNGGAGRDASRTDRRDTSVSVERRLK